MPNTWTALCRCLTGKRLRSIKLQSKAGCLATINLKICKHETGKAWGKGGEGGRLPTIPLCGDNSLHCNRFRSPATAHQLLKTARPCPLTALLPMSNRFDNQF